MTDISIEQEQKRIRDYRLFQINSFYPNPATYRVMMVDQDRNDFYQRAIKENVNDIELAAEAVEEISHNPESVITEAQSTFENVTVSRAKYLNNLVNQYK